MVSNGPRGESHSSELQLRRAPVQQNYGNIKNNKRLKLELSVKLKTLCVRAQLFNHVQLFATPWTLAHQIPLSMGFPRQEYWSGLPFPPPGDLPNPRLEPESLVSPALAGGFFTTEPLGNYLKIGQ